MHKEILITGGAGFIGAHCAVLLQQAGYEITILDNLSNSSPVAIDRIEEITGKRPRFIHGDILDNKALDDALENISSVIHLAGLKAVGESVQNPLHYYHVNVGGLISLLQAMRRHHVRRLVFSSSATVYGTSEISPLSEEASRQPINPYGQTKNIGEDILKDLSASEAGWQIARLRYFNPGGAHPSGRIGEDPKDIPNNLLPYISQVASGKLKELSVFGNDYDTRDGTGLRDYIHVMDLAEGHIAALEYLEKQEVTKKSELLTLNLGSGENTSVLELVKAFEQANHLSIPYKIHPRRPGDIDACWANPSKAKKILGWKTNRNIEEICRDQWHWQSHNPQGYEG
ncbi:UDP-glucose 4-epimerase GalE [Acetobacteraceae bacterium]|nr:UDP-glucose 4-epimerase GalE [Acetobacteraceae bacterium]